MDLRNPVHHCGTILIMLLVIALIGVALIFQPVTIHQEVWDIYSQQYVETVSAPAATTQRGMALRAEAWKEYPQYNIGLGVMSALAFTGAIYASLLMYRLKEQENDAL